MSKIINYCCMKCVGEVLHVFLREELRAVNRKVQEVRTDITGCLWTLESLKIAKQIQRDVRRIGHGGRNVRFERVEICLRQYLINLEASVNEWQLYEKNLILLFMSL
jgi:hypothetical protein